MDRNRALVALLAALGPAAGCFLTTDSSNTTTTSPTLVTVDPVSFEGSVRCAPGEWRLYAVTMTDVTPPLAGFEPPVAFRATSGLVPCNEPVLFAGGYNLLDAGMPLEIGHYYVATIDGYDTDDVELFQTDTGATRARRISTKEPVLPRWTTTCGDSFYGAADAAADGEDGAQTDGAVFRSPSPFRRPTLIVDSVSERLQGCVPFDQTVPEPPADAGADGPDLVDASAEGGG